MDMIVISDSEGEEDSNVTNARFVEINGESGPSQARSQSTILSETTSSTSEHIPIDHLSPSPVTKVKEWMEGSGSSDGPFTATHLGTLASTNALQAHDTIHSSILVRQDFNKPIPDLTDPPLNPDQKKRYELYSYLKLTTMNEAKSETQTAPQQRRSSRLKHLSYMEKKHETVKAKTTPQNKRNIICVTLPKDKCKMRFGDEGITKKSLAELGINLSQLIKPILNNSLKELPVLHLNKFKFFKSPGKFKIKSMRQIPNGSMNVTRRISRYELRNSTSKDAEDLRRSINNKMICLSKTKDPKVDGFFGFHRRKVSDELKLFRQRFRHFCDGLSDQYRRFEEMKRAGKNIAGNTRASSPIWIDDDCIIIEDDPTEASICSDMEIEDEEVVGEDNTESDESDCVPQPEIVNINNIKTSDAEYIEANKDTSEMRTLQQYLMAPRRLLPISRLDEQDAPAWMRMSERRERRGSAHVVSYARDSGDVLHLCYADYNLVIVQENLVTFWTQSALGNVMGSQKMWIPRGGVQRLILGSGCVRKPTHGMVMTDNHHAVVYVELWTKEHVSDKRERPVTDVFVTLYIRQSRSNGPYKKVLQLENINGYSKDVQYAVVRNSRNLIVSWISSTDDQILSHVHCYTLPEDFQKVGSIRKMESPNHRICSLHTIEDCDDLVMGSGDFRISLWNFQLGHLVVTIDLSEVHPDTRILWTKNDRGFLFVVRQCEDGNLDLVAINSYDNSWKRLRTYKPDFEDDSKILLGVCLENGLLIAFYEDMVIVWNADSSLILNKYSFEDSLIFICGNYICVAVDGNVFVSHHLQYLMVSSIDT